MKSVSKQALKAFKEWGRKGGQKRAWKLSASKRQSISRHAAQMRWGWKEEERNPMSSVRLRRPLWENPVYLEEVLLFGGLKEWRELHRIIGNRPFGAEAGALEKVLEATSIYGASVLWKGILKNFQGDFI